MESLSRGYLNLNRNPSAASMCMCGRRQSVSDEYSNKNIKHTYKSKKEHMYICAYAYTRDTRHELLMFMYIQLQLHKHNTTQAKQIQKLFLELEKNEKEKILGPFALS
jgi:hypothetical protein